MKKIFNTSKTLFVFGILSVISVSCCTKKYCDTMENAFYNIDFYNFPQEETDTVNIIKYEMYSDFTVSTPFFLQS